MIPGFTQDGVLPPFLGVDSTHPAGRAPYQASIIEVVDRFSTTPQRRAILGGFLAYRARLAALGVVHGFQWLDGSFCEDVEGSQGRAPGDIDFVTFFYRPQTAFDDAAWFAFQQANVGEVMDLFDRGRTKALFNCDAFAVDLHQRPDAIVQFTHYWYGLFSHRRNDYVWKGLLQVPMHDAVEDAGALAMLAQRGSP